MDIKNNTTNIFDGDDFGQNDLQDQAMLDKILQTYWFYYYAYDVVDFVKTSGGDTQTHTLRYDKQRDDLGMAPFYYYTTESNPSSTKVYVNIKSADYENFEIYSEAGELIANNSSINLRTVVVYDFDGSYLYLKLPKTSNTGYDDANLERYYRVYEIPNVADYVSEMSTKPGYNASDYTWVNKHEPRYYVDVLGVRYYLLPRTGVAPGTSGDIAKNNKAQVLYDKYGNTTVAASGSLNSPEIAQYATFENINNYFVEYYEEYYQVNYTVYTDKGGSKFINPKADPLTNTVTLPEMAGNPTEFYLNYGAATLYYNGAPTTINHYMYCPVNTNYKSNVEFRSSLGRSSWETAGVTIKTLPSPHIGYWYDGGEEYAFVGYIMVNDAILETITKRGDSASGGEASSGDMYRAFLEYINAVYKFEDYDALEDFASQAALDSYLTRYTPGQSGYGAARMQEAYTNFIADLKEKIGVQVGAYKLVNLCSNLLLADSYDYEDYGNKMISYVNVNVPVTFKDMAIANPKTGASTTSLSVMLPTPL